MRGKAANRTQRVFGEDELKAEIAIAEMELAEETDPDEAAITERDIDQMRRQLRELTLPVIPRLRDGSNAARILAHLGEHGSGTARTIAAGSGIPLNSVLPTLSLMYLAGQIRRKARGEYAA